MATYQYLPGIEVAVADGGLILPEDIVTQSMLIIAPSLEANAPTEPARVRQQSDLEALGFGDFVVGGQVNPIAAAWKAAYDGGCRRIFLMALEGSTVKEKFVKLQDKLFGVLADFNIDHVVLVGAYADEEATGLQATDLLNADDQADFPDVPGVITRAYVVEGTGAIAFPLTVTLGTNDTITINDGQNRTLTLTAKTYANMNELLTEINGDLSANSSLNKFKAIEDNGKLVILGDKAFTIGNGNANTALKLTNGAAATLKKHEAGVLYNGSFAKLLADYAESQSINFNSVIAYIGTTSPANNTLSTVKAHIDSLLALDNNYSPYLQVVAGPELGYVIPGKPDIYYMNGAVTYAALVSTLRPESAPTNKRVYGVASVYYNPSLRQSNSLVGKKYVTFRLKNNQVVVADGVTTAPDLTIGNITRPSDFARLSTLRVTQAAIELIRQVTEPFIGEPNRMPQYNAMNAAIKGGLEAMKTQGAIMDYRFTIVASGATLNESTVTLELVPTLELKKVKVNVTLNPPTLNQ